MDQAGHSPTTIGLVASVWALGIFAAPLALPMLLKRFHMGSILLAGFVCNLSLLPLFRIFELPLLWGLMGFSMSAFTGAIFLINESWLIKEVEDAHRGKASGIYISASTFGLAAGSWLLGRLDLDGWSPILWLIAIQIVCGPSAYGVEKAALRTAAPTLGQRILGSAQSDAGDLCVGSHVQRHRDHPALPAKPLFADARRQCRPRLRHPRSHLFRRRTSGLADRPHGRPPAPEDDSADGDRRAPKRGRRPASTDHDRVGPSPHRLRGLRRRSGDDLLPPPSSCSGGSSPARG